MWVTGKDGRSLDEAAISGGRVSMGRRAGVVESGENTRRATFFDQVAHDLIVEVLDWSPLNLLPDVFLLFSLEGEFDENLL